MNWLSNRIFKTYDDIVALCCEAWNRLDRSTLEDHVDRTPKMGPWVLINARWYKYYYRQLLLNLAYPVNAHDRYM